MVSPLNSRVAVIMCTYEPSEFLSSQVNSIKEQSDVNISIFIFDDGTNTQVGKNYLLSQVNEVEDIRVGSPTGSAGKNFIRSIRDFDMDTFDYLALSDQDDIWFSDKLSHAINQMRIHGADGYSSDLIIYDGEKEVDVLKKSSEITEFDYHFQGGSAGCTYVLTAKLVKAIQTEVRKKEDIISSAMNISHDWLIYFIARTLKFKWVLDPNAKILYRQHDNNVYGAKRTLFQKFNMVFGDWYIENIKFISAFKSHEDVFNVDMNLIKKLQFLPSCFRLRREKMNSFICYLFWLFKYKNGN